MTAIAELREVSKEYPGGVVAVCEVSLSVRRGELVITHDHGVAAGLRRRVEMHDGRIVRC